MWTIQGIKLHNLQPSHCLVQLSKCGIALRCAFKEKAMYLCTAARIHCCWGRRRCGKPRRACWSCSRCDLEHRCRKNYPTRSWGSLAHHRCARSHNLAPDWTWLKEMAFKCNHTAAAYTEKSKHMFCHSFFLVFCYRSLLVEGQRDDIVLCDSNCPVALSSVRIRFRIVWRQNQPTRTCQVPATWSYDKGEVHYSSLQPNSEQQWYLAHDWNAIKQQSWSLFNRMMI